MVVVVQVEWWWWWWWGAVWRLKGDRGVPTGETGKEEGVA